MESYKSQESRHSSRMASPTSTICDTTTDTHIQHTKDGTLPHHSTREYHQNIPVVKDNNDGLRPFHKLLRDRDQHIGLPTNLDHHNQTISRNSHAYQRIQDCQTSSHKSKRHVGEYQNTSKIRHKRNRKGTEITKHEVNFDKLNNFDTSDMLTQRHFSDTKKEIRTLEFENEDRKQFVEGDHNIAMKLPNSDPAQASGSRSMVPEEIRLKINSRERERMHDLNTALDSLRQVMPYSSGPSVKKLSKMSTLLLARNYIVMLTRSLEEMKRLVQELSASARPKPIPTTPLLPDSAYVASILAANQHNPLPTATANLYLPSQTTALHRIPSIHCVSATGLPNCTCVDCQRKNLLAVSTYLESKKSSS